MRESRILNAVAQTKFRARHARGDAADPLPLAVELGADPPIEAYGSRRSESDRRRLSLRWLLGSTLVGVAGGGLISLAICAAFDRPDLLPQPPEFALTRSDFAGGQAVNPRTGDRILKAIDLIAAKHSFRAAVTLRAGRRQIVRFLTFARVDTPLAPASLGLADQVPRFNPLRLISDSLASPPPPDPGPAPDDAEVSFEVKNLATYAGPFSSFGLNDAEARAQVEDFMRRANAVGDSPPLPAQLLLLKTSRLRALDPAGGSTLQGAADDSAGARFSSIKVTMVPENVTAIPQTSARGAQSDKAVITVGPNETLAQALARAGAPRDQIDGLDAAFGVPRGASPVREGDQTQIQFIESHAFPGGRRIARVAIYSDQKLRAAVALDDQGRWQPVRKAPVLPLAAGPSVDGGDDEGRGMRLWDSLFETEIKQGVSLSDIDEIARIVGNDVDFQAPVVAGDAIDLLYRAPDSGAGGDAILYVSITSHGRTFKYYRFRSPADGRIAYYDPSGHATHKFLVREPVLGARLTSPFGMRFHPILGYARMHTGVDWAAPIGTPVYAAGDGVIIKAGRESGYGNRIEIQHANDYVTTYSHLSGFARGVAPGAHVRQGQVIAYLGMTGLATGPHLHYEVIVNGHFVDPLRVKLTHTKELEGEALADFQQAREQIDRLLAQSGRPAQLAAQAD